MMKTPMQHASLLAQAVLASTVFCTHPMTAHAFTNLDPASNGQSSSNPAYPPFTGYQYTANSETFIIVGGTTIGNTASYAVDTNQHINETLIFVGNATVAGIVNNFYESANTFNMDLQGDPSTTVTFNGNFVGGEPPAYININLTKNGNASFRPSVSTIFTNIDNTSGISGQGTIKFQGGNHFTLGSIGATNPLNLITLNAQGFASGSDIFMSPLIQAKTIEINDDKSGNPANGANEVFTGPMIINTNSITVTTNNEDRLTLYDGVTLNASNIGTMGSALNLIQLSGGNNTLNGNVFATLTQFTLGGTALTIGNNTTINGNIDSTAPGQGTLIFSGNGTVTGPIGATNALNEIDIQGGPGTNVIFPNTVNVQPGNINFNGTASPTTGVTFNDGATITANIDSPLAAGNGELTFLGSANVNGTIGVITHPINAICLKGAGSTVNFNQKIDTKSLCFALGADPQTTVNLGDGVILTSKVDNLSGTGGNGLLQLQGGGEITGNIGTTKPLGKIIFDKSDLGNQTLTLDGTLVNVNNIVALNKTDILNLTGLVGPTLVIANIGNNTQPFSLLKVAANGNITINGNVFATNTQLQANNSLTLGDGNHVTGNITSLLPGNGTLIFAGDGSVTGNVGPLDKIDLTGGDGKNVTLIGNITPGNGNLNFASGSSQSSMLTIGEGSVIHGNVDNLVDKNMGVLQCTGNCQVTGNIGVTYPLKLIALNTAGGANTIELDGEIINANDINVVGASMTTLKLNNANPMVLTGNITTNNNNIDTVETTDALVTINGNAGSAGHIFKLFKVDANTNVNGNIFAGNTQFQDNKMLTIGNNAIIRGPVTTTNSNQGILTFIGNSAINSPIGIDKVLLGLHIDGPAGSVVTLSKDVGAMDTQVNNGGTLLITKMPTLTGDLNINKGVLSLSHNVNPVTINGAFNLKDKTALQIDFGHKLATRHVVAKGTANISPGAKLIVHRAPLSVADGVTPFTIVTGSPGSKLNPIPVFSSSLLLNFFMEVDKANNALNLFIDAIPVTTFANQSNTRGIAGALDSIINSSRNGMSTAPGLLGEIIDQLDGFTSIESLNQALAEFAPTVDGAVLEESFNIQLETFDVVTLRVNSILHGKVRQLGYTRQSGYNAGDRDDTGHGAWVKFFGQYANQKTRDMILGYHDNVWGIAAGYDWMFTDNNLAGFALSWGKADVDNKISKGSQTDIDSFQTALYGQYVFGCPYYLNWFAAIGYNDYDAVRHVTFGDLFFTPKADYHAWQYSAKAEVGYVFGQETSFHTVPIASLYYSYLDFESYTETGAGTANQIVHPDDADILLGGVGLRFIYDCYYNQTLVQPQLHLMAYYDFINDKMQTQSQFVGAGPSFITSGANPVADSYVIGASISTFSEEGLVVTLNYDYNFKQDYRAHAGFIRARYEW
ncbi:MAG: autotransporter domain-containing protein [Candidatus Berkiellales bacterium]